MTRGFLSSLSEWLFIDNGSCPVCGKVLVSKSRFLCSACEDDLRFPSAGQCEGCGRMMTKHDARLCSECITHPGILDGGFSWLIYDRTSKALIEGFKFHQRPKLAFWCGTRMSEKIMDRPWLSDVTHICAVPLHVNRYAERGYNQSERLAEGIRTGLAAKGIKLSEGYHFVTRPKDTPHQVGMDPASRMQNVKDAFAVPVPKAVKNARILLVDDVLTTGATLFNAALALKKAGAAKVYAAACASVPGE